MRDEAFVRTFAVFTVESVNTHMKRIFLLISLSYSIQKINDFTNEDLNHPS